MNSKLHTLVPSTTIKYNKLCNSIEDAKMWLLEKNAVSSCVPVSPKKYSLPENNPTPTKIAHYAFLSKASGLKNTALANNNPNNQSGSDFLNAFRRSTANAGNVWHIKCMNLPSFKNYN